MRLKFVFSTIIIAAFLCFGNVYAQLIPSIQRTSLSENDKTILDQSVSKYTTFTIDKEELVKNLYKNGKGQYRLRINEELDWTLNLEFNDMRSLDFKQTYTTVEGEFEFNEPFLVNTFKGETSNGQVARFTIDDDNFFGVIFGDNYHYVIRPANDYTKNHTDKSLIVYKSSDIF